MAHTKQMASKSRQVILTRGAHQLLSQGGKHLALMAGGGGAGVAVGSGGEGEIQLNKKSLIYRA